MFDIRRAYKRWNDVDVDSPRLRSPRVARIVKVSPLFNSRSSDNPLSNSTSASPAANRYASKFRELVKEAEWVEATLVDPGQDGEEVGDGYS